MGRGQCEPGGRATEVMMLTLRLIFFSLLLSGDSPPLWNGL